MSGAPAWDADPLRRRVMIYTLARLVVVSGFFAVAVVVTLQDPSRLGRMEFFRIAAGAYLWIGMSAAAVRKLGNRTAFVLAQLAFDTALVTVLVLETGGTDSVFSVLYFVNILGAAYLMETAGAVTTAIVDGIAYAVPPFWGWRDVRPPEGEYAEIMLHLFGFLLVGLLTGHLTSQLAKTGEALRVVRHSARRLAEQHAAVLELVPSGVLLLDSERVVRAENRHSSGILGSALGLNIETLFPDFSDADGPAELGVATALGPRRLLADCSPPTEGGVRIVVFEDVTRLRDMEDAAEREERLEGVGRMAAAIAHEIRNPLASLSGALQMLSQERGGELVDLAQREVLRLRELVDETLEHARPGTIHPCEMRVDEVVADVIQAFSNDPRYAGSVETLLEGGCSGPILADPARVRQVLWNLLLNAAQMMPDGGTIRLSLEEVEDGVNIRVIDDGPGMSAEVLDQIFDPFFTRKRGGTGLGLSAVEQIVHAHSGKVSVSSSPGQGASFTVFLPRTSG